MINHMGNYPNPSGTTCLSTLLSEEVLLLIYLFISLIIFIIFIIINYQVELLYFL